MKGMFRWLANVDIISWFALLCVLGLVGKCTASAIDYFDKRACRNTGGLTGRTAGWLRYVDCGDDGPNARIQETELKR